MPANQVAFQERMLQLMLQTFGATHADGPRSHNFCAHIVQAVLLACSLRAG